MTRVTVLVPTHAERPQLDLALDSARAQDHEDLEILVVGDGCPDSTREIVARHVASDERVRFLDRPKGARHGEEHRAEALDGATGSVVTYLSDDDLLYPDHVRTILEAFERDGANFGHSWSLFVDPDGEAFVREGDLSAVWWRDRLLGHRENFVPATGTTHTMALYRALPEGWAPAPPDCWVDLYMWRKFLAHPDCVVTRTPHPTCVIFAAPDRPGATPAQRYAEIAAEADRLDDAWRRQDLERSALRAAHAAATERHALLVERGALLDHKEAVITALLDRVGIAEAAADPEAHRAALAEVAALRDEVAALRSTRTWRLRGRLLRLPGAARALGVPDGRRPQDP